VTSMVPQSEVSAFDGSWILHDRHLCVDTGPELYRTPSDMPCRRSSRPVAGCRRLMITVAMKWNNHHALSILMEFDWGLLRPNDTPTPLADGGPETKRHFCLRVPGLPDKQLCECCLAPCGLWEAVGVDQQIATDASVRHDGPTPLLPAISLKGSRTAVKWIFRIPCACGLVAQCSPRMTSTQPSGPSPTAPSRPGDGSCVLRTR